MTSSPAANPRPPAMATGWRDRLRALTTGSMVRGFVLSFAPTAVALALQLATFILMGRGLGAFQFGELSAALALALVLVEVVGLGSGDILVRGVVTRPNRFSEYFGNALLLGGVSLPFCIALAFVIARSGLHLVIPWPALLAILASETLNSRVSATVENICVAHKDVVMGSIVRLATAILRFTLAALAFGVFGVRDLQTWIACCVVQSVLTSVAFLVLAARRYGRPKAYFSREEFGTGLLFATNQTARAAQGNLDRAFMGAVAAGPLIGAYAAASRVAQLALFPVQIANRLLYPRFFAKGAEGGIQATRRFALQCAPLLFLIGVGCAAIVDVSAFAVPRLLGADFQKATAISLGLACALPFMAIQYPPADALTGSGRQALRTAIFAILSVLFSLNLGICVRWFGLWGLVGAFVGGQIFIAACLWALLFQVAGTGRAITDEQKDGASAALS